MSKTKHKRNKAYAPKKPSYTPMTKEEKIRYGAIILAAILVIVGLVLWNKYAPWNGSLPVNGEYNLIHEYNDGELIVNMDDSSIVSHRSYYITGKVNSFVEGYTNDPESTIRSDKNTTDFLVRPDEGTDSPFSYYYITASNKPVDELTADVYETMSKMYDGYMLTELTDGEFAGKACKYFTYLYDASHDEQPEETESSDGVAEAATSELAECAVAYFPASRNTTVIIQTPVKVDNDPANFVDEQVMLDMIEKIVPTIDFMN